MLFIPSIKGISHSFEEDTSDADIALGCQVYAGACARMLTEDRPAPQERHADLVAKL